MLPPVHSSTSTFVGTEYNAPVVRSLAFLPWLKMPARAGAPEQAVCPRALLAEAVLPKCTPPASPLEASSLRTACLLASRPTLECITRVTTAFQGLGSFDKVFNDQKEWLTDLRKIPIPPPQQPSFEITKTDYESPEPFNSVLAAPAAAPQAPAAGRASRRSSGTASQPSPQSVPQPPPPMPPPPAEPATFKWLAGLPIPDLVQDHELPFAVVGRLQSLLHDGVLRAGRASPTSMLLCRIRRSPPQPTLTSPFGHRISSSCDPNRQSHSSGPISHPGQRFGPTESSRMVADSSAFGCIFNLIHFNSLHYPILLFNPPRDT